MEEQEESALNIAETYNSLQQEVEVKTKKLKKVKRNIVLCDVTVKLLAWTLQLTLGVLHIH